jgi:hypothetical protein
MFEKNFGQSPRIPAGRGKIARLPDNIREQLNQRLLGGQPASTVHPCLRDWRPRKEGKSTHFLEIFL